MNKVGCVYVLSERLTSSQSLRNQVHVSTLSSSVCVCCEHSLAPLYCDRVLQLDLIENPNIRLPLFYVSFFNLIRLFLNE